MFDSVVLSPRSPGLSPISPEQKRLAKLRSSLSKSVIQQKSGFGSCEPLAVGALQAPNLVDRLAAALRKKLQKAKILDTQSGDEDALSSAAPSAVPS